MNWFTTTEYYGDYSKDEFGDCCEHMNNNKNIQALVVTEYDSYGIVDKVLLCKDCYEKLLDEEGKEIVRCNDCGERLEKSLTKEWKWYDFYPPQGDEPLIICEKCWNAERHQRRLYIDEVNRKAEEKEKEEEIFSLYNYEPYYE